MPLKTPAFWYQPSGLMAHLLTPVSWLYQLGHTINQILQSAPYRANIPVICIGNALAGGSGKTPTVIALVQLLKRQNIATTPFILTRGYGGTIKTATHVNAKHTAQDVGDEALLLARNAPTIIAADRSEGAKLAEKSGADLIIMDDGLQNNSLHKTLSFLVVERRIDFGNGKTIPAGPLREPLRKILPKVQSVICIGRPFQSDKPVFEAAITPTATLDLNKKYIAFAGLGRPEKFKDTLENLNINLVGWHAFADHHAYTLQDIETLKQEAAKNNATLITTEKDHVRLPADFVEPVETLAIEMTFQDTGALLSFIKEKLDSKT